MFKWLKERSEKKKEARLKEIYKSFYELDPSLPINFGHKNHWLAVKAKEADQVCDYLGTSLAQTCNWIEGSIKAREGDVFITPSIKDWVLISSFSFSGLQKNQTTLTSILLEKLSLKFEEAHFYANRSSSSYAEWAKYEHGQLIRHYQIADFQGQEFGEPTEVEKQWKLIDPHGMPEMSDEEHDTYTYPSFTEMAILLDSWSFNPMTIETLDNVSTKGYFCTPKELEKNI